MLPTDAALFDRFLTIARALNARGIEPLLCGSLGLERVTGLGWAPGDIDVFVPGDPRGWDAPDDERIHDWPVIEEAMSGLGYRLVDLHEHEFAGPDGLLVQFGDLDELPSFAGIDVATIPQFEDDGARYRLLTAQQYLRLYEASSLDGYRAERSGNKDAAKVRTLRKLLELSGA